MYNRDDSIWMPFMSRILPNVAKIRCKIDLDLSDLYCRTQCTYSFFCSTRKIHINTCTLFCQFAHLQAIPLRSIASGSIRARNQATKKAVFDSPSKLLFLAQLLQERRMSLVFLFFNPFALFVIFLLLMQMSGEYIYSRSVSSSLCAYHCG